MESENDVAALDRLQEAYRAAVEEWIAAIKHEEALCSVAHDIADVDAWEDAHFKEDELRDKVLAAKKEYEDALREKFYDF
jgi:energy-converting hydrogenase A subunit M